VLIAVQPVVDQEVEAMKAKSKTSSKRAVTKTKAKTSKVTKARKPVAERAKSAARSKTASDAKPKARRGAKSAPVALTTDERRKLLKPKDQFVDVVERTTRALGRRREIRVPGMTAGKLKSLTAKAVRAAKREGLAREQFERKIRPLSDARLLAEDAAYRALLNVYAAVKLYTRADPGVGAEFAFLIEHLTFTREKAEPAPAPERVPLPAPEPA
jgi:hypothetical protein